MERGLADILAAPKHPADSDIMKRRFGVIAAIYPGSADIYLSGGTELISGVKCANNYAPTVGDTVVVAMVGPDPLILCGINGGAWTPYTPTLGGGWVTGNGTNVGRYRLVGKTLHIAVAFLIGSTTTIPSGGLGVFLPTGMATLASGSGGITQIIPGMYFDTGAGVAPISYWIAAGTSNMVPSMAASGDFNNTMASLNAGDLIRGTGCIEIA